MRFRFQEASVTGPTRGVSARLILRPQEVMSFLPGRSAVSLSCLAGCIHVTQAGSAQDHILLEGDLFQTSSRGKVVVSCFRSAAAVRVETGTPLADKPPSPWRGQEPRTCQTA